MCSSDLLANFYRKDPRKTRITPRSSTSFNLATTESAPLPPQTTPEKKAPPSRSPQGARRAPSTKAKTSRSRHQLQQAGSGSWNAESPSAGDAPRATPTPDLGPTAHHLTGGGQIPPPPTTHLANNNRRILSSCTGLHKLRNDAGAHVAAAGLEPEDKRPKIWRHHRLATRSGPHLQEPEEPEDQKAPPSPRRGRSHRRSGER